MISRRRFISGALGGGAALVAQGCQQMAAPPRSKRLIVDSQVHLWQAETPDWRWVPGIKPHLPEPFTIEKLLPMMDDAGVEKAVLVQAATCYGYDNSYVADAIAAHPVLMNRPLVVSPLKVGTQA